MGVSPKAAFGNMEKHNQEKVSQWARISTAHPERSGGENVEKERESLS